jgi:D-sedoheptulose 7-phosphate isomerase
MRAGPRVYVGNYRDLAEPANYDERSGVNRTRPALIEALDREIAARGNLLEETLACCRPSVATAIELLTETFARGGRLYLCGNGGSASLSSHLAAELVASQARGGRGLPAVALTADTPVSTALSNDHSFVEALGRTLKCLGRKGDVLLAISTSGTSENIVNVARVAKQHGISVIVLTGSAGSALAELADVAIRVPAAVTEHVQEMHCTLGHVICRLVSEAGGYG